MVWFNIYENLLTLISSFIDLAIFTLWLCVFFITSSVYHVSPLANVWPVSFCNNFLWLHAFLLHSHRVHILGSFSCSVYYVSSQWIGRSVKSLFLLLLYIRIGGRVLFDQQYLWLFVETYLLFYKLNSFVILDIFFNLLLSDNLSLLVDNSKFSGFWSNFSQKCSFWSDWR